MTATRMASRRLQFAAFLSLICLLTVACNMKNGDSQGGQNSSGGGQSTTTTPSISSLSQNSGNPLSLITVTGTNFDSSAAIWVTFSNSAGISVQTPPLQVTPTSLLVAVPLILDSTGAPLTGAVSLQISQAAGNSTPQSNAVQFTIQSASAASPLPAGSLTLGFVQGEIAALQAYRQSILGGALDTAQFEAAYAQQISAQGSLAAQIESVMGGAANAYLGTVDNGNISITAADLQNSDALLLGMLQSTAALPQAETSSGSRAQANVTASAIQQQASSLYSMATVGGTTQVQLSTTVDQFIGASANSTDVNFAQNLQVWTGPELSCTVCAEISTLDPTAPSGTSVIELAPFFDSVTQGFMTNTYLQAAGSLGSQPGLVKNGLSHVNLLSNPLLNIEGGLAGELTQADLAMWLPLIDQLCGEVNCNTLGGEFVVNVSITGSTDNITNVQVCSLFGGNGNSVCGPNGGFAVGETGSILISSTLVDENGVFGSDPAAVAGTNYTISVPANQNAASYCSVISGGSGTFGSSMPAAVVNCQ
jgi:hypothetical protein